MPGMGEGVDTNVERRMPMGEEVRVIFVVSSMSSVPKVRVAKECGRWKGNGTHRR